MPKFEADVTLRMQADRRRSPALQALYERIAQHRDHAEMIEHPELWAFWPHTLPLKRPYPGKPHDMPELGFLIHTDGEPRYRVRLCRIAVHTDRHRYRELPFKDYPDARAIVADGWVVD